MAKRLNIAMSDRAFANLEEVRRRMDAASTAETIRRLAEEYLTSGIGREQAPGRVAHMRRVNESKRQAKTLRIHANGTAGFSEDKRDA